MKSDKQKRMNALYIAKSVLLKAPCVDDRDCEGCELLLDGKCIGNIVSDIHTGIRYGDYNE